MKTALLIHGYNGIPKIFDYFKSELEKLGYEVIMSALPTQQNISYDSWKNELNNLQIPSEISLLIAHSIGNEFMIRYCAERGLKAEVYIGLAGFVESFTHEGRDDLNNVIAKNAVFQARNHKIQNSGRQALRNFSATTTTSCPMTFSKSSRNRPTPLLS